MLAALFGVGLGIKDYFTQPKNAAEVATPNSKNGHSNASKHLPTKEPTEIRRATPIENTAAMTPLVSPSTAESTERLYLVIGIAKGDTLNVRSGPGANNKITAQLPAGFTGIRVVGQPVMNGSTEWVSITFGDRAGWVTKQYLQSE